MATMDEMQKEIVETQEFVRERLGPVTKELTLMREEQQRLSAEVRRVLERERETRREEVLRKGANGRLRARGGKLDGFDLLDLAVMRSLLAAQQARPHDYDPRSLRAWEESVTKAMDSVTAGSGDELVPQEEARQLWADVNVGTAVASLFETVTMPTNPFDVPLQLGDVNWYPGAANTAPTGTDLATAKQTLTAYELVGMRSLLAAQQARPHDYDPRSLRAWEESVTKAMDSVTAGSGDELVPQEEARQLWADVNVGTAVASLFETVTMPTNPFDVPLQLGDVNWYPGAANTAPTGTDLATAKQTLTAYELVGMVPWAYELEEDAVIAMMAEVRSTLIRNAAQALDDVILNADASATGNVNYDGGTLTASTAGSAHYLVGFDGLVHQPLVDNASMSNNFNAVPSADMFNKLRRLMGKYGLRPSELAFITDVPTYIGMQTLDAFQTIDKLGPRATLLTGQLGSVEGVPVIVSEQLRTADADGKVTSGGNSAGAGRLLLVNRTQWRKGFRRELLIETDRDARKRQNVMVVSMRVAFAERTGSRSSAKHTALHYNVKSPA